MSDTEPNVILRGGHARLSADQLVTRYVADTNAVLKLRCGNHYEHFTPSPATVHLDGREMQVFVWTMTTYVAE